MPPLERYFSIKNAKDFQNLLRETFSDTFIKILSLKQFPSQKRMNGCDCGAPDGHLDTKIDQIDLRHILMSYASLVKIRHFMSFWFGPLS